VPLVFGLLQQSGDETDQAIKGGLELFPEGRIDITKFLGEITDGAALNKPLLFKIALEPEKKSGQPIKRRQGFILEKRAHLFSKPGLIIVHQG